MAEYIWSLPCWPDFSWNRDDVMEHMMFFIEQNTATSKEFGHLLPNSKKLMFADTIAKDAVSSSDLEGVSVSYDSVYSSVAKMLELSVPPGAHGDRNSEALAGILREASATTSEAFDLDKMTDWHRRLFDGLSGSAKPGHTGDFRNKSVYVMRYSSSLEGEVIYEGVPHERIPEEIGRFMSFIKNEKLPAVIRSAVSAAWFPLIHPFEDGNGRLSRIISDMILFGGGDMRCISVSSAISKHRKEYYSHLEKLDTAPDLDLTEWICWYMDVLIDAMKEAEEVCRKKLMLSGFMALLDPSIYNSREINMLYRLASGSFYGRLTADKWKKMTKCTAATATRDLSHLVERGLLMREGDGGRGTWYSLSPDIIME